MRLAPIYPKNPVVGLICIGCGFWYSSDRLAADLDDNPGTYYCDECLGPNYSSNPKKCDHAFCLEGPFWSPDGKRGAHQLKCCHCQMVRRKGIDVGVDPPPLFPLGKP